MGFDVFFFDVNHPIPTIIFVSKMQSCKTCSNFLRVKFKVFNLRQNMAFSSSNIYTFKTIQNLKSPCYWLIPISYWPVFSINQVVDCIVRLTFVLTECSTTKPSSLTSHMVNLPHGWYPRTRCFFATLQKCWVIIMFEANYFKCLYLLCVLYYVYYEYNLSANLLQLLRDWPRHFDSWTWQKGNNLVHKNRHSLTSIACMWKS